MRCIFDAYLTHEEESRLMIWLSEHHPYLKTTVLTALRTGMRRGEILSLRWALALAQKIV